MRAVLLFLPYFLVPLLLTLLFNRFQWAWKGLTFLITTLIIFFYPFVLFWIDNYFYPPSTETVCYTPQMGFIIGNAIILLPISLLMQFVFNAMLLNNTKDSI
jgi:hypothetical protein